ncbi:hypothetical protein IT570_09410 [Candidatus Sumerlaeota bacterium]|nr:hypothetical protein [Candidatus Sumerlaeota bacterium]
MKMACLVLTVGLVGGANAQQAKPSAAQQAQKRNFLEKTTSLPLGRAFHSLAVVKDFIYVFGGSEYDPNAKLQKPTKRVSFAPIHADGQLGAWQYTTSLPEPRHYTSNSTLVLNDTIYIIGGSTAPSDGERVKTVIWTRPQADGQLENWRSSAPLAQAGLACQAAFVTPGYLWMTGGLPLAKPTSQEVYSITVLPDGSLGDWERSSPLPIPLWFHQAGVVGGRVYIWGGLKIADNSKAESISDKIFSAPVLNTGKLGPWTTEKSVLPKAFYAGSSANAGSYLFSFSTTYVDSRRSTDIWWTMVTQDGIQPWRMQPSTVPMKIYHAAAPDYLRGSIYFVGGKNSNAEGNDPLPWVVFFRLTPEARKQAEAGWMALQAAHKTMAASASTLELADDTEQATAAPANAAAAALPTGIVPYEEARSRIAGKKPLVVYFRLAGSKPCLEQDAVLTPEVLAAAKVAVGSSDIRSNPQLAQQFGVFRSPTWIFYDSLGQERSRHVGVISPGDMAAKASVLN